MTTIEEPDVQCECCDERCPHPVAGDSQCLRQASCILYRSDLRAHSGSAFCESCAEDALDSGMYYEYGEESD